jgi:hypothetical protein
LLTERAGRGRLVDDLACFGGPFSQDIDVPFIQIIEQLMQPLPRFGGSERIPVGLRGQSKAVGDTYSLFGQPRIQLA